MTTDDVLEVVNGLVISGLLHKLSGDNEPNERNSKVTEESSPDDDTVIIFEKLQKRRIKGKEM